MADGVGHTSSLLESYLDDRTMADVPERTQRVRKSLEDILSPIEPWIMDIQSLLVWESLQSSLVLISAANVVFW